MGRDRLQISYSAIFFQTGNLIECIVVKIKSIYVKCLPLCIAFSKHSIKMYLLVLSTNV